MNRNYGAKLRLILILITGVMLGITAVAATNLGKEVRVFELANDLDSDLYNWPETLLSYPLEFSEGERDLRNYRLVDRATSEEQVIQWSDLSADGQGGAKAATLNFLTSLSRGQRKSFALVRTDALQHKKQDEVQVSETPLYLEMHSKRISVRIPKSVNRAGSDEIVGPIAEVGVDERSLGSSRLVGVDGELERFESRIVDKGPLFATAEVTYTFKSGGRYIATIRVIANYDHFEFSETMESLSEHRSMALEINWDHFHPTRRFAANGWKMPKGFLGIDEPVITDGIVEEPHWFPPEVIEDPAKEMIFKLASYQGNQPRNAVPVMSFWEPGRDGVELSAFVGDALSWRNPRYAVWQPDDHLNIGFRFSKDQLTWSFPLVDGSRSIGVALHNVERGERAVSEVRDAYRKAAKGDSKAFTGNVVYEIGTMQLRYAQLLRSWYGALSLNKTKDWVLKYPEGGRAPTSLLDGTAAATDTPAKLEHDLFKSALAMYPLGLNLAVMNISHRVVGTFLERYATLREKLSFEQKHRIDALLLMCAYLNAGEELSPVRTTLAGAPNMAADGFCIPAEISAVFPDHPMGQIWRDQFEKTVELNSVFYTRPAVDAWNAQGGRWAESLATYHWAQLLPITTAQLLASSVDRRNYLANSELAERAEWLVGQLTAPVFNPDPEWRSGKATRPSKLSEKWKTGDALVPEFGFERQIPAHGAHSSGTTTVVPDSVAVMADSLMNFAPLAAEHLWWARAQVRSQDKGEWRTTKLQQRHLENRAANLGTPPLLASAKYTGHGIVLRAGVGTPEEVSVHLDQIDQGPNYRWGNSGEGNSGTLYFYAGGKVWTGHETENSGDHTTEDTLGTTTFGVWKNGAYRSIGANVLDQPLHDVGVAQLATITARSSPKAYAWPQYRARSVMLVGTDYFLLMDEASGPARFSWFNARDLDLPKLIFLEPQSARPDHWTEVSTRMSHGILRDVSRDTQSSVVLVTHKQDAVNLLDATQKTLPFPDTIPATETKLKPGAAPGVFRIQAPQSRDLVFRSVNPINYREDKISFTGTAGVVRQRADGRVELAILAGTSIGAQGVEITLLENNTTAVSAVVSPSGKIEGRSSAPHEATRLRIKGVTAKTRCFVDGNFLPAEIVDGHAELILPKGSHTWELTEGLPMPISPLILATNNFSGGAEVHFTAVAAAENYVVELSQDNGGTWKEMKRVTRSPARIDGLKDGVKVHVRVRAMNAEHAGKPSGMYPVYISSDMPAAPEGFRAWLGSGQVTLSWGEVLGVTHYQLYRRARETGAAWERIYSGAAREFTDRSNDIKLPDAMPGSQKVVSADNVIWEYVVSSVNGNGEGAKSQPCDTDPASWRNWWPAETPRKPKRITSYALPPYGEREEVGAEYYP